MPLHDHRCLAGHVFERFIELADLDNPQVCKCGAWADRIYTRFPMSFVREDVRYESPVDGRQITSYQQHLEDLARSDCVLYESGIKQDQERNAKLLDAALERSVDETVDREIALMPAVKREKLVAELENGLTATPQRGTVQARPIVTELEV